MGGYGSGREWQGTLYLNQLGRISVKDLPRELREKRATRISFEYNSVPHEVEIEFLPCNYGGQRAWFGCPCCGRRCGVLYLHNNGRLACRLCWRRPYRSQSQSKLDRIIAKIDRLKARAGGGGICDKPKWMRWGSFSRLHSEIERLQDAAIKATPGLTKLLKKFGCDMPGHES